MILTSHVLFYKTKTVSDPISKLDTKMVNFLKSISCMSIQLNDLNYKLESSLTEMKHLRKIK